MAGEGFGAAQADRQLGDPQGIEGGGAAGNVAPGLGLLDLSTVMERDKTTRQTTLHDPETGAELRGYEIHHGVTEAGPRVQTQVPGLLWRQGNVRGTYLHGLLENPAYLHAFLSWAGLEAPDPMPALDARLDAIAGAVQANLDWKLMLELAGGRHG